MPLAAKVNRLNIAEYLEAELRSQIKHEYVDGRVFAMTGVSRRHNLLNGNLYDVLRKHLAAHPPGRAYFANMKVFVEAANAFYYPDVTVTRESEDTDGHYVTDPLFVAEILSPDTENIDRREKLAGYTRLDSLREYMLVEQERQEACLYRRDVTGQWWQIIHHPGETLTVESLELSVPLAALYAGSGI